MGRKKNNKSNQPRKGEQTKTGLVEIVSTIMKERGHHFLRTMQIIRRMRKGKNIIRYHYLNLNNLLREYISKKDYWPGFFARFNLKEQPNETEVIRLFTELMQDNLKLFQLTPEMQKIILWQISQESPMLKSVSEEREVAGAKVMAMASPYFADSDVHFEVILSLLLGGSYYLVLHNETNKSTVCGVDITRQRDMEKVLKTIGQIISWAFEKAKQKRAS